MSRFCFKHLYTVFKLCSSPNEWCSFFKMSGTIACAEIVRDESILRKRPADDTSAQPEAKRKLVEFDRIKRRKVAMLLAYSGQGYLGMQRNPGTKTIEEDLLRALFKSGYLTEEALTTPQLVQFQRAARTDKGVSATRQIISAKLPEDTNVNNINEHLPDQIHVFAIKRTTKGFNSKTTCDARTYSYTLPTFAFTPIDEEVTENFRITPEIISEINSVLKMFEGTHNFHNFTSRKKPLDPSAYRYVISFECSDPFLHENLEFCTMKVKAQSFMLHQIRKMVGLAVAILRGHTTKDTLNKAWKPERLDIPVAPGLGLVLEELHYDRYNKRYGDDGIHKPLTWEEVENEVNDFRERFIYSAIVKNEISEKSMLNWLLTLPRHTFAVREQAGEECDSSATTATASPFDGIPLILPNSDSELETNIHQESEQCNSVTSSTN